MASKKLFALLETSLRNHWAEVLAQADRNVLRFPPSHADKLGYTLFHNLQTGGLSTLLVTGSTPWDPKSPYYEACREAARRNCKISRLFLLPHRQCRHDPHLREHIALDQAAGVTTRVLYIGDLLSSFALPIPDSLEIGLWDEQVTCTALYGLSDISTTSPTEWRVSCRPEDIELQRNTLAALSNAEAISTDSPEEQLELEEPMVTTAPVANLLAPVLCRGDHVSREDCSWYHGVWQYLRIFDMVSTPTWHASFYLDALSALARTGCHSKILISGTADYSMLAHVLWAYRDAKPSANVTVIDLCETPLFLCKWYATLVGTRVATIAMDLLECRDDGLFDVIATDAFLTRFLPSERSRVGVKWAGLLRSGGQLITTARIEPGQAGDTSMASDEDVDAFRARADQEANRWHGLLGIGRAQIATMAANYARRMVSHSFRSIDEIVQLLRESGFDVVEMRARDTPGEMASTTYAEAIAIRR